MQFLQLSTYEGLKNALEFSLVSPGANEAIFADSLLL